MGSDLLNDILRQHADALERVSKAVTPREYRGWPISWDYGSFTAIGPNYDVSWEGPEDGWVDNGEIVTANTLADLFAEVDEYLRDSGSDRQAKTAQPVEGEASQSRGDSRIAPAPLSSSKDPNNV